MHSALFHGYLGSRRRAAFVVVLWLIVLGAMSQVAPTLDSVRDDASGNLPPAASQSMQARDLVRTRFSGQEAVPALVAVRGAGGEGASAEAAVDRISTALSGPDRPALVGGVISSATTGPNPDLVSADGSTQLIVVPIRGNPSEQSFQDAVDQIRALVADRAGGAEVAVTGPAGIATDTVKVFSGGDKVLLLGTIVLVLVILLLIYRSPLLALVPLLAAGMAMRVTESVGALMAGAGWFGISSQTASIMTVLLFGVGTDYALIVTAGYREALDAEMVAVGREAPDLAGAQGAARAARHRAMVVAMSRVGETILSSVSTVVLAMVALLVCVSPSLRGFGPYLALGVAVMALVAFTFIPAVVLLLGRAVFWPVGQRRAAERGRGGAMWHRVADLVVARPRSVAAASLAILAVLSLGLTGYGESFDFVSGFRVATQSERGQDLVRDGFGPGEVAPSTVLLTVGEDLRSSEVPDKVADGLRATDGVARVGQAPQLSMDGRTAAYRVVLDSNPYGSAALDAVPRIRQAALQAAEWAGAANPSVLVAGESAQTADTRAALDRDLRVIVPLVLLVVAVVLGLLLRSIVAPVYLVLTLLLSFAATMGATVFFTVTLLGDDGIGNRVSAYVFVFLVALGVDYTIFIMSRFRQEARQAAPPDALRTAITRTGGVVSSAGLILAATFSVLMTQPIRELFQFGFAMAFGILLDTFVIRPLLVPAVVRLLGDFSLWPRHLHSDERPVA